MSTYHVKSHAEKILQQLWKHRETDPFSDVVVVAGTAEAEEIKIPAHRCILSAASEYFKRMFTYEKSKEIKINDVDSGTLNSLVEYCYTGSVEIKEDIDVVQELLRTADMLLLNNVAMACGNFLEERLHPSNCLGFTLLAERYNCQKLLKSAKIYTSDYFMDVCETEEFLNLETGQLGELLSREDLHVPSEGHKFRSLINWIEHNPIDRGVYKDELLNLVQLPLLQPDFLAHYVKPICISVASSVLYEKVTSQLSKPRASYEHLMALTRSGSDNMAIQYYCPLRLKWMKWWNKSDLRRYFGLAVMEHKVYIAGGCDASLNILNTVICVNMKTMTLVEVKSMIEPRENCSAAVLNGFLYVAGGFNGREYLSSVERYDPKNNTWNKIVSMSLGRSGFGFAELNNKLYAIGGSVLNKESAEFNDPDDPKMWTSIPCCSTGDKGHLKVVAVNGLLYALAARNKIVERYDTLTKQWTSICSLHMPLSVKDLCTTFQDKLLICNNDRVVVYNATENKWETDAFLKGLGRVLYAFSYSDQLLATAFAEN